MEKNKMHPVTSGKNVRMSYSKSDEVLEMPNLIEVQTGSFKWFVEKGLQEVFEDISPISPDYENGLSLELVSYKVCTDEIKYGIDECKERSATYEAPIRAIIRLSNAKTMELKEHEIFLGNLPLMTDSGSFVINGAERVIVSQLVRSPGIYFDQIVDKDDRDQYTGQLIPNRGAWLEFETSDKNQKIEGKDEKGKDKKETVRNKVFYLRLDRNRKFPFTALVRALLGPEDASNDKILEIFGNDPLVEATIYDETNSEKEGNLTEYERGLKEVYKKIRPGDPFIEDSARSTIEGMLFDDKRYDLAKVGRYKYNKKLAFNRRLEGQVLADDVIDEMTGEVLAEAGTILTRNLADDIQNAGVASVAVKTDDGLVVKVLSNRMVKMDGYVNFDPAEVGVTQLVNFDELQRLLSENPKESDLKAAIKETLKQDNNELIPNHITRADIFASINYLINLTHGVGSFDNIDHLGNRRIRSVGELLQNQYRIGLTRMEKAVRERMSSQDIEEIKPQSLINIKPITAAVKEFFGSSQLSQFMDQNNPLSELTHKRRLSALGPGGLSRDRAGFEVRDVHYTHYGRMCPIETPEGPNIGLINSLASYARINEYGFIEAPYRVVNKKNPEDPVVTDEVVYLTADEEDDYVVAQANAPLDAKGHFTQKLVSGRYKDEISQYEKSRIDLMDVSPKMVFSVATSMIPFLQNDDANRALMGSNMQRQAVPLMLTERPVIGTGMEAKAAVDSGVCIKAEHSGTVESVSADTIVIKLTNGKLDEYKVSKFKRSNQSNCYNQRPIVDVGDKVKAGDVIADGPSTKDGEIGLGKNPLIGFMTWEGYNYEDAVLISERLVKDDVYTSIHIEEYETEARDTKLGPEDITNDVPGVGEDSLKNLDERGIIRIGAEVRAGDILVGKVTPKGETELTAEERLLRAIFGEKAREVRDTSLKLPHGAYGTIVDTKVFSRALGDELPAGVNQSVRIYVAQKRKISVGDKMAGRHGNKGVVSRVLPVEDMPYLPNGRPLDIVLNPLGVPSRMNIGQVLETHLSLAAEALGIKITTPIFNGATESDIMDALDMANDYVNSDWKDFEKKYGKLIDKDLLDYLKKNQDHKKLWEGVPITRDGKVQLRDGRTGEFFDGKVTIGHMHYLKLHHLVDDKIHARSTGPYSLVTQQPLGGKAQFGGQRFGEMEVWALEAYGAAYTLQEILTVKSDDVVGRVKTYEAIIKGKNIPTPSVPESFKVLLKELQSLCLDMTLLDDKGNEVEVKETADTAVGRDLKAVIEGDDRRTNEKFSGYTTQEFNKAGDIVDVEPETSEEE